jgi:hypothetical protein
MRDRNEDIEDDRHLFVDDDELRRRINPTIGRDRFRSALRALEAKYPDFPKIHALFRGRYWPAVKAWLDCKNGVRENDRITPRQDGPETFDAPSQQSSWPEMAAHGQPPPAVLGRQTGRARP